VSTQQLAQHVSPVALVSQEWELVHSCQCIGDPCPTAHAQAPPRLLLIAAICPRSNVLLRGTGGALGRGCTAKISDFGLAIKLSENATHIDNMFQVRGQAVSRVWEPLLIVVCVDAASLRQPRES
jgi:hypothetical protein